MALTTPTDRTLLNVVVAYERELMGPKLTTIMTHPHRRVHEADDDGRDPVSQVRALTADGAARYLPVSGRKSSHGKILSTSTMVLFRKRYVIQ